MGRRILVTGLSSFWGGRLAQALERDPEVEVIIGVSPDDPTLELERTEYVRVGTQHALLRRIVRADADDRLHRLVGRERAGEPAAPEGREPGDEDPHPNQTEVRLASMS